MRNAQNALGSFGIQISTFDIPSSFRFRHSTFIPHSDFVIRHFFSHSDFVIRHLCLDPLAMN